MTGASPETKVDALRDVARGLVKQYNEAFIDQENNTPRPGLVKLIADALTLAQQAAYERAAQLCEANGKECYERINQACHYADAADIRALGSASALELALAQARREGAELLQKLCDKLDRVEEDTKGIFVLNHVHGGRYTGANWAEEYKAAREYVARIAALSEQ